MELLALYLWLKLDSFLGLCFVTAFLCSITLIFAGINGLIEENDFKSFMPRIYGKTLAITVLVCAAFITLMPSTKDAAILAGAYFALEAAESPEGKKVVSLLRKRVGDYLDAELAKEVKR